MQADPQALPTCTFDRTVVSELTVFSYSNGESEVVLGKALKKIGAPRASYVVLTKV
jgi:hypothetical protein